MNYWKEKLDQAIDKFCGGDNDTARAFEAGAQEGVKLAVEFLKQSGQHPNTQSAISALETLLS